MAGDSKKLERMIWHFALGMVTSWMPLKVQETILPARSMEMMRVKICKI